MDEEVTKSHFTTIYIYLYLIIEHSLMLVQNYMQNLNKILISKFGNH